MAASHLCHLWHQPIFSFPRRQNVSLAAEINKNWINLKPNTDSHEKVQSTHARKKQTRSRTTDNGRHSGNIIHWMLSSPLCFWLQGWLWIKRHQKNIWICFKGVDSTTRRWKYESCLPGGKTFRKYLRSLHAYWLNSRDTITKAIRKQIRKQI